MRRRLSSSWVLASCGILLLSSVCALPPFFSPGFIRNRAAAAGGGPNPPASPLLNQKFEGTGYDNSETWTESLGGGIVDEDYTATVLDGSQSLRIQNAAGGGVSYTAETFTAGGERWAFCKIRLTSLEAVAVTRSIAFWNNVGATLAAVEINTSGTLHLVCGATTADTVDAMSTGTTYYMWFHYLKGTGANAVADVGFSTTSTRPTSGNKFVQITTGSPTTDAVEFAIHVWNNNNPSDFIYDRVYVDDEQIGDNP